MSTWKQNLLKIIFFNLHFSHKTASFHQCSYNVTYSSFLCINFFQPQACSLPVLALPLLICSKCWSAVNQIWNRIYRCTYNSMYSMRLTWKMLLCHMLAKILKMKYEAHKEIESKLKYICSQRTVVQNKLLIGCGKTAGTELN